MPVSALFLALGAASLHALWNVLLARSPDTHASAAAALLTATIVFAPVAALTWEVQAEAWPYIVASATLELAYFALLAAAYRRADLGLVYPLARGTAPVLVLGAAAVLLGVDPTAGQAAGVLVIVAGVFLVRGLGGRADTVGTTLALAVAVCIAGYTLVDKEGLEHANPLTYLELVLAGPALAYGAAVAATQGTVSLRAALTLPTAAAGICMFGSYALVLGALELAAAAPVAAVRETSVVLAAVLAVLVLHERLSPRRLAGAVLVAGGIAILVLS